MIINILLLIIIIFYIILLIWYYTNLQQALLINNYSSSKNKNIKIISYNINYLPWTNKNLDEVEKIISKYDIVCLQELFTNLSQNNKQWLEHLSKKYKYNVIYNPKVSFPKVISSGLAILTKYKINEHNFYLYKNSKNIDRYSNKGILSANIQVNDKRLNIYNTHMQAYYNKRYYILYPQIKELKAEVKNNFILTGDFNVNPIILQQFYNKNYFYIPKNPTIYSKYKGAMNSISQCEDKLNYKPDTFDYFISDSIKLNLAENKCIKTISDHTFVHAVFNL